MTIEERLERVERQNRNLGRKLHWFGRLNTVLLAAFCGIVFMGQAKQVPRVVEARRFVLKDKNEKERAVLGFDKDGNVEFSITASHRTGIIMRATTTGNVHLGLYKKGKLCVNLAAAADGSRGLVVFDETPLSRIEIAVHRDQARVQLSDKNGKRRLDLRETGGRPILCLRDTNETARFCVEVKPSGSGLRFSDKEGRVRAVLVLRASGAALLGFPDGKGMARTTYGTDSQGAPSIAMKDSQGEVIWKKP